MEGRGGLRKMQVDYIILPSQPYNIELSTFYWHLQVLFFNQDFEPGELAVYFSGGFKH
jgi:hypothetical protein